MKKPMAIAAVLFVGLLAFHLVFPSNPALAAADSAGQGATRITPRSPELEKDTALDASAARLIEPVTDPLQDSTAAPEASTQISSRFGSRPPRKCPVIASLPTTAQAVALVQCTMDYETPQQAKLHQDISVQLATRRNPTNSDGWPGIDSRFPVVDFAASATVYLCGPVLEAVMHNTGKNCDRYQFKNAPGICWKTIAGGYRCQINAGLPTDPMRSQPPPTTY